MNVRHHGHNIGTIEQVQNGNWFASHVDGTQLGAFRSRPMARNAVIDYHFGMPVKNRIMPTVIVGPLPRGQ